MKNHYILEHRKPHQPARRCTDIVPHWLRFAAVMGVIVVAMSLEAYIQGI